MCITAKKIVHCCVNFHLLECAANGRTLEIHMYHISQSDTASTTVVRCISSIKFMRLLFEGCKYSTVAFISFSNKSLQTYCTCTCTKGLEFHNINSELTWGWLNFRVKLPVSWSTSGWTPDHFGPNRICISIMLDKCIHYYGHLVHRCWRFGSLTAFFRSMHAA